MNEELRAKLNKALDYAMSSASFAANNQKYDEFYQTKEELKTVLNQFAVVGKVMTSALNAIISAANNHELPFVITEPQVISLLRQLKDAMIEKAIEDPLIDGIDSDGELHSVVWQKRYDEIVAKLKAEKEGTNDTI